MQQLAMSAFFFLGVHLFMACFEGVPCHRGWLSSIPIKKFEGTPYCLNEYIYFRQCEDIIQALCLANLPHPTYANRFYDVQLMIDKFNQHYSENHVSHAMTKALVFGLTHNDLV